MKVAVCISGLCRGKVQRNLGLLKEHFPYDYFYGTWKGRESDMNLHLKGVDFFAFPEPKMHYHPILDVEEMISPKLVALKKQLQDCRKIGPGTKQRVAEHTKQIIAHAYMLELIDPSYDMIIRTRYDVVLSMKVDFTEYLTRSYEENRAVGFGTRQQRHRDLDSFKEIHREYPDGKRDMSQDWGWYLMDPLIFHPRKLFDTKRVWQLHNDKKLLPAENGWYQILSQPYSDNHLSVYGGVQIEKYM